MHHAIVRLAFADEAAAKRAQAALLPDNGGYLRTRVDGNVLVLEASGATPLGMLRSLEDAFNGLRATGLT